MQNTHLLIQPYRFWLYSFFFLLLSINARSQDHVIAVQLSDWGYDNTANMKAQIDEMANQGVTAVHFRVSLSDLYTSYTELTSGTGNTTQWNAYDDIFNHAYSKGMKVALSINVTMLRDYVDAFYGGSGYQYLAKDQWNKPALISPNGPSYGIVSLAYSNGVDRLKLFVNKVITHFNNLHANTISWVSVTTTAQWEFGYNYENHDKTGSGATFKEYSAVYDYSSYSVSAFRSWLTTKYGTIAALKTAWGSDANSYLTFSDVQPPMLSVAEADRVNVDANTSRQVFTNNITRGKDWYDFQQSQIKGFANAMKSEIQGINSNIKFVEEYGSNVDELALFRIAYDLKGISDDVDGLKTQFGDFHWNGTNPLIASDLVRTNTNKPIYTEINPHDVVTQSTVTPETEPIRQAMFSAGKSAIDNGGKWIDIIVPSWHQLNNNTLQDKEYAASKLFAADLRAYTPVYKTATVSQCISVQDLISNYSTVMSNWLGANNSGNTRVNVTLSSGGKCLSVSKKDLLVAETSSVQTFKIYATNITGWTVSTSDSWLSFNTSSGSATTDINVTVQANGTSTQRKGKITVTGNGITHYINVYQKQGVPEPIEGCYTIKTTIAGTNLYLAPASGNLIQQAAPSGTNTQAWNITEVEPGYYKIVNAANPGLVLGLEIEDCSTSGDKIKLVSWTNNDYQKWQMVYISSGNWTFINKASCKNRAILVPGNSTTAGTLISTYDLISPTDAQQVFTLTSSALCSCTPPAAPTVTASSSTVCTSPAITSTLTASGCAGTVTWNGGQTGSTRVVSATGTYSATCTVSGCATASAASNVITITTLCPVPPTGCFTIKTTIAGTNLYLQPTTGNLIQQAAPSGTNTQAWQAIQVESNYYKIVNMANPSLVLGLEVEDCISSGDRLMLRTWTNSDFQKWEIIQNSNGTYSFVNKSTCKNRAILVPDYSTAAGTIIVTYDLISAGDAQQRFTLTSSAFCSSCTPPAAPTVSAGSPTICTTSSTTTTLTASGCAGTITWNTGHTGSTRVVSTTGTYSAICTVSGCTTASIASNVVNITEQCTLTPGCYTVKTTIASTNLYLAPASGNLVQQAAPSGTNTQAWQFIQVEGNYFKIVNAANPSLVLGLEVEDCSTTGDRIKLVTWTNNDYQKWEVILVSSGNYTFVNKASCKNRAILVPGYSTTAGTLISTYDLISPSDAQQVFTLTSTALCPSCTPPAAPTVTANSTTICNGSSVTLTASGCIGTVTWNGGQTGNTRIVSATGTYSATCTVSGCTTASIASNVATITSCVFSGGCYTIKTTIASTNLYLAPASGNLIQQAAPSGTNSQAWKFTEVETGYYKIENAANPGLVLGLEIEDCNTLGDRIKLVSWANNDYQKWQVILVSPNNYTFVNKALCANRAILVPGYSTSAGTLISTYELINPSDAQQVFTLAASSFCGGGARIRNEIVNNEKTTEVEIAKEVATVVNESAIEDLKLEGNKFILYPNPASDQIEVKYYLPSASMVSFTLFNVSGNVVDKHNVQGKAGYNTFILKLNKHESGTYILKGVFGFKQDSKKFVIER